MFCIHCGKALEDGSRFCMYCGKPIADAPVAVPEEQTVAAVPVAVPEEQTVAAVPVAEAPAEAPEVIPEETMAAEPAAVPPVLPPREEPIVQTPPVSAVPQPEPAFPPVYSDPIPPVKEKKAKKEKKEKGKKGKAGPIIAIVLVLLLLIGGGVGYYLYTQHVYEENLAAYDAAEILLNKQDYDGALEAFRELGDFEDAADRVEELEQLQEWYDSALELLEDGDFNTARETFEGLGDYRDSKNYAKYEVSYQEARSWMATAAEVDASEAQELYLNAADLFTGLGDYTDSADLASECLLNSALIELDWEDYDDAMSYLDLLTPADQTTLRDAYAELCADEAFLLALEEAYVLWYDESKLYSDVEELRQAMDMIKPYADAYFDDSTLAGVYDEFMDCMGVMYSTVGSNDSIEDVAEYYRGMYLFYCLADNLYYNYGVFADDETLRDTFVGVSDYPYAYWKIEESLTKWWNSDNAIAQMMDDGYYYSVYTNDTGLSYTLYARIYFYDDNDILLETGEWMEIYVAKGATVYIPTIPTTVSTGDWSSWYMEWDYSYGG